MIYTHSNKDYDFYTNSLNGEVQIIRKHKITGELLFDAECLARAFGFESLQQMIESDTVLENMFLDGINENKVQVFKKQLNPNIAPF